jgi:hypothetical protein
MHFTVECFDETHSVVLADYRVMSVVQNVVDHSVVERGSLTCVIDQLRRTYQVRACVHRSVSVQFWSRYLLPGGETGCHACPVLMLPPPPITPVCLCLCVGVFVCRLPHKEMETVAVVSAGMPLTVMCLSNVNSFLPRSRYAVPVIVACDCRAVQCVK